MRVLKKRVKEWFINDRKIKNAEFIKNLDEAELEEEEDDKLVAGVNDILIMDSYEEMVNILRDSYVMIFRLYDNFKRDAKTIWIDKDANLKGVVKEIGKNKYFIGSFPWELWKDIRLEVNLICGRKLVVKREWLKLLRDELTAYDIKRVVSNIK